MEENINIDAKIKADVFEQVEILKHISKRVSAMKAGADLLPALSDAMAKLVDAYAKL